MPLRTREQNLWVHMSVHLSPEDGEEDADQGGNQKPAGMPATSFSFPVLLTRGSGTALRMGVKEPLCVKHEYTSQSIGQSTSPVWKGTDRDAIGWGG